MKKVILIVIGIFVCLVSLLSKSAFLLILYLIVVGCIFLYKRIDEVNVRGTKTKSKLIIKEDDNYIPRTCDLIVFNSKLEIMDILNNTEFEEKFKITIKHITSTFHIADEYLGKYNNGCYALCFEYYDLFSNINKIIRSRLDTYMITGMTPTPNLKYILNNNISFDTLSLYVNNQPIANIQANGIFLYKEGKVVATLDKSRYNDFKTVYSRDYSVFFPTSFDSYMQKMVDREELQEIVENAFYYQRKDSILIVNSENNYFCACTISKYGDVEKKCFDDIKAYLLLTNFTSEYKDSLGNTISIKVK